jgi:hypothetical protein
MSMLAALLSSLYENVVTLGPAPPTPNDDTVPTIQERVCAFIRDHVAQDEMRPHHRDIRVRISQQCGGKEEIVEVDVRHGKLVVSRATRAVQLDSAPVVVQIDMGDASSSQNQKQQVRAEVVVDGVQLEVKVDGALTLNATLPHNTLDGTTQQRTSPPTSTKAPCSNEAPAVDAESTETVTGEKDKQSDFGDGFA